MVPQPVSPVAEKRKMEQTDFGLPPFDSSWHRDDDDWALFSPCPAKKKNRIRCEKKSVRFAPEVVVSTCAQQQQQEPYVLSKEDVANAWYTPDDWKSFKAEARATVAALIKANGDLSCLDEKQYSILGLEEYTARCMMGGRTRSPRQRMIVRQILEVQRWQRSKGIEDQAAIKNAYMRLSQKHRSRAVRRASLCSTDAAARIAMYSATSSKRTAAVATPLGNRIVQSR